MRSAPRLIAASAAAAAATLVAVSFARAPATVGARSATAARRDDALRRARVWQSPATPVSKADLSTNPGHAELRPDADVPCRFDVAVVGGLTPKFPCTTPAGERLKVRYGELNREIPAELAATRLMSALGFPVDAVYAVRSVRCEGCPRFPFLQLRCYRNVGAESACMPLRDAAAVRPFAPALVERGFPGTTIESGDVKGWSWLELDAIDHAVGASRAEVDALRIMAVLLAHWDNKSENQRLICPKGAEGPDGRCDRPIAMISDLGGSFGPVKVHLAGWRAVPMWADARACEVSMESLPYQGGTFPRRRITERGRRFAAELLERLSSDQLHQLFSSAGFKHVPSWVAAFRDKVAQVQTAGPCPIG